MTHLVLDGRRITDAELHALHDAAADEAVNAVLAGDATEARRFAQVAHEARRRLDARADDQPQVERRQAIAAQAAARAAPLYGDGRRGR